MTIKKHDILTASYEDKIKLIRINVKMVSLLEESDSLYAKYENKTSKYIKYKVKKPFLDYIEFVDKFNSVFMKQMGLHAEDKTIELIKMFNDASKKIDLLSEEKTELVLFYCKVSSVYDDLISMYYTDLTMEHLKELSLNVLEAIEKQFKNVLTITDPEGNGVSDITKSFNRLGNNILYKV